MGHLNTFPLPSAPTETADLYPESDGKPMAETERHFRELVKNMSRIETHFAHRSDAYVMGDMMMYYEEGNPRKFISPDIFVAFGIGKKERRIYKIWEEGKPPDFALTRLRLLIKQRGPGICNRKMESPRKSGSQAAPQRPTLQAETHSTRQGIIRERLKPIAVPSI